MARESAGHTLDATAVVHEAYVKIAGLDDSAWEDRNHFLSIAASAIRRVLVDHARTRGREKRGGDAHRMTLHSGIHDSDVQPIDVVELDDALTKLSKTHPNHARLVELRFFGGMQIPVAAERLGIGRATAVRHWRVARAWLRNELGNAERLI